MNRDSRGHCALQTNFHFLQCVTNKQLRGIGALLLMSESVCEDHKNINNVSTAFIPQCSSLKCYRYSSNALCKTMDFT